MSDNNQIENNDEVVFYEHKSAPKKKLPQGRAPSAQKAHTVVITKNTKYESVKASSKKADAKKKPAAKRREKKYKLTKKRVVLNVVCSVLAVVMILAGTGSIFAYNYFNRINYEQVDTDTSNTSSKPSSKLKDNSDISIASDDPKTDAYNGTLLSDPDILNIMLFGADTRKGEDKGQSDTMILFSIDTKHKKLKMLSFMRDTFVDIPGYESQKLNASYTFGGASLAIKTIQLNYGIKIDRYAVVDFGSFKNIIDTLGGIDVELSEDEVDYINWQFWINNQDEYKNAVGDYKDDVRESLKYQWLYDEAARNNPIPKNELTFTENKDGELVATVHLNGQQALWHARNRGEDLICSGDDYERTKRQREVLGIIINDLKASSLTTILSVLYEIGPMITTNLKTSEITALATNAMTYLKYDLVSQSAPVSDNIGVDFYYSGEDYPVYVDGYMIDCIVIIDWNRFRQKIATFVFETMPPEMTESSEQQ